MAQVINGRTGQVTAEPSTAELVQRATEQVTRLVRDELALARVELAEKGRHAGRGLGLFSGGGVLALYAFAVLIAAGVMGLAEVMPAWAAALIVGAVLLVAAGAFALFGRAQVRRAVPPVPAKAAHSVRADMRSVSAAVRRERSSHT